MTAVDPLSVSCDEYGCHVRPTATCMDRWGREVATHATRIGKARAVAEAREQASVNPLLTPCPRDNCEEAGRACIEWTVIERSPGDGRPERSTAREVAPHPERVEKAEAINALRIPRAPGVDAATLGIMEIVNAAPELDRWRILALLRCRRELPAIDAIVRVLGQRGTFEISPDRLEPLGHLRAAWRHVQRTIAAVDKARPEDAVWPLDDGEGGTGELHIVNAAGRLWMAAQLVMEAAK